MRISIDDALIISMRAFGPCVIERPVYSASYGRRHAPCHSRFIDAAMRHIPYSPRCSPDLGVEAYSSFKPAAACLPMISMSSTAVKHGILERVYQPLRLATVQALARVSPSGADAAEQAPPPPRCPCAIALRKAFDADRSPLADALCPRCLPTASAYIDATSLMG